MLEKFEEEGEEEEEEELELEEDQDQAEGSGSEDDLQGQGQGDLARGMEGERVVKSGYLWKKQERRKVSRLVGCSTQANADIVGLEEKVVRAQNRQGCVLQG